MTDNEEQYLQYDAWSQNHKLTSTTEKTIPSPTSVYTYFHHDQIKHLWNHPVPQIHALEAVLKVNTSFKNQTTHHSSEVLL